MTSPISAIGPVLSASGLAPISAPTGPAAATSASGPNFATVLGNGLDALNSAQSKADGLAVQAATGDLTDVSQYSIAATQASLMTELASTLRTKGVEAFNQIMGMQA
jgi:flagellar hook-basal body complex protein FliE